MGNLFCFELFCIHSVLTKPIERKNKYKYSTANYVTPTTLAVEPANFLHFLRLAVKVVTSCGFLWQVFYLLAL